MFWYNIPLLSAFIFSNLLAFTYASPANPLVARQTPSSCAATCQGALDMITVCANSPDESGCLCPNGSILQQCIDCGIATGTGTAKDARTIADSFNLICVGPGFSTAPLTLPAGTPPSSAGTSAGSSVTVPLPLPNTSVVPGNPGTPIPTPVPTPSSVRQVTVGPSTTPPAGSSMQGKASKSMLMPSFGTWSLVVMALALFSL